MLEKERELQEMDARVRQAETNAAEEARSFVQSELQSKEDELATLRGAMQALEQENKALKTRADQLQRQGPRENEESTTRKGSRPPAIQIPVPAEITVGDGERTPTEDGRNGRGERPRRRSQEGKVAKSLPNLDVRRRSSRRSSDGVSDSASELDIPLTPSRKRGEGSSIPLPVGVARVNVSGTRERNGSAQQQSGSAQQQNGSAHQRNGRRSTEENPEESTSDEDAGMSARIFANAGAGRIVSAAPSVPGSPTGHKRPVTAGAKPGVRRRSSELGAEAFSTQRRPVTAAPQR
jgi:hypothetical protein